jgi:DnaD/phage-associated family protein
MFKLLSKNLNVNMDAFIKASISDLEVLQQVPLTFRAFDLDAISGKPEKVKRSLDFWVKHGFLCCCDKNKNYVEERIEESCKIESLLKELQNVLGRTLSGTDIYSFIALHDQEGLPCEVILHLAQYCAANGKTGTRYIEKVGIDWAANDVKSIEKAEEKIRLMSERSKNWALMEKIIGARRNSTTREEETVDRWVCSGFGEEMLREAYERCVSAIGKYSIGYMDAIITRWKHEKVFSTKALFENESKSKMIKKTKRASYNLAAYENSDI